MSFDESQYQASLDYLYSFVDYSLTRQDRLAAANFNLERMVQLMNMLGNPQEKFKIVHVAGKGYINKGTKQVFRTAKVIIGK